MTAFDPQPPTERPWPYSQVDWSLLKAHLRKIYGYRSNALHSGVPFPVPMCEPPNVLDDGHPIGAPMGLSTMALDGEWIAADAPMLLWVFEHITRQTLLAWWNRLPMWPGAGLDPSATP